MERPISDPLGQTPVPDLIPLDELQVEERRVLVRCDFNVPLQDGTIGDDFRIRASVPTLRRLREAGASLVACSHLGRPKGRVVEGLRLGPVAERLGDLLDEEIVMARDVVGESAQQACHSDAPVVLLENLRFEPGEEANNPAFARQLASLADAYVDDAFGAAHRAHASVVGVAERLPHAAGLLLSDEVSKLGRLLAAPERPFVAVLGGAKVSDKLKLIANLLDRVDALCVGGAMAFTLLAALGEPVGRSLVEEAQLDDVAAVLESARSQGTQIVVPTDVVAAEEPKEGSPHEPVPLAQIDDRLGVDIGPATAARFADVIEGARSVLWNGPMGIFEIEDYAAGTRAVARSVAKVTRKGAYTVVGGGDSAAALRQLGLEEEVSHLSTGGGASLEFLEGRELPGLAVLLRERSRS